MALKPGGLWDDSYPGSMTRAIEDQLNDLLARRDKDTLDLDASEQAKDRRQMFAAIARGVVAHLAAHPEAFVVTDGENRRCTVTIDVDWDVDV